MRKPNLCRKSTTLVKQHGGKINNLFLVKELSLFHFFSTTYLGLDVIYCGPLPCGWFCVSPGGFNLSKRTFYVVKLERQHKVVKDQICRKKNIENTDNSVPRKDIANYISKGLKLLKQVTAKTDI